MGGGGTRSRGQISVMVLDTLFSLSAALASTWRSVQTVADEPVRLVGHLREVAEGPGEASREETACQRSARQEQNDGRRETNSRR